MTAATLGILILSARSPLRAAEPIILTPTTFTFQAPAGLNLIAMTGHQDQQEATQVIDAALRAESLRTQADRLVQAVAVFRLSEGDAAAAPAAQQAAPALAASAPAPAKAVFVERRGPNRARNVVRPAFGAKVAAPAAASPAPAPAAVRNGSNGDWETF